MTDKEKWITILVCFCLLILLAGFGAYKGKTVQTGIADVKDLQGKTIGGVNGRMPENSAKVFFESMLGVRLGGYKAYDTVEEALYALKTGKVSAVWATNVTADYLVKKYSGSIQDAGNDSDNPDTDKSRNASKNMNDLRLGILSTDGMASISQLPEGRFEFGFALKNDNKGKALTEKLNEAINGIIASDIYRELVEKYIVNATTAEKFTPKDMAVSDSAYKKAYGKEGAIRVGITGATEPIELIDVTGKPYGFCVAFMDEIGQRLGRTIEFEVLDNETIFTSLMSGRIDAVFCYGTPGQITTEGTKNWIMSDGYLRCNGYRLVTLR
ncbi:MAG: transporter substrate-binding domain-containing protein [Lachnospiraceae bacterium]|nr:transporter substrate-binding domain-containing protein [Lachnospiraceae bacterium]